MDANKFQSDSLSSNLIQNPADKLDELCDQYDSILSLIHAKHVPFTITNVTTCPFIQWYNDNIKEAKTQQRKYESKWQNTGLAVHRELYIM